MAWNPIAEDTRKRLKEHDKRWRSRAILRVLATFCSFVALVLFAVAVAMTVHWGEIWNGGGDWTDGMALAPVLISLIFNPTSLFIKFRTRRGRPYHPGWDVGFDLLIWALSVPSITFSVGSGWFWWWQRVIVTMQNGEVPCRLYPINFWSEACQPTIYTIGKIEIVANFFLAFILIIHFTLFVMACIATHRWRRRVKKDKDERRNIELQYHRSPEEHMAQQPQPGEVDKDIEANGGPPAVKYA